MNGRHPPRGSFSITLQRLASTYAVVGALTHTKQLWPSGPTMSDDFVSNILTAGLRCLQNAHFKLCLSLNNPVIKSNLKSGSEGPCSVGINSMWSQRKRKLKRDEITVSCVWLSYWKMQCIWGSHPERERRRKEKKEGWVGTRSLILNILERCSFRKWSQWSQRRADPFWVLVLFAFHSLFLWATHTFSITFLVSF